MSVSLSLPGRPCVCYAPCALVKLGSSNHHVSASLRGGHVLDDGSETEAALRSRKGNYNADSRSGDFCSSQHRCENLRCPAFKVCADWVGPGDKVPLHVQACWLECQELEEELLELLEVLLERLLLPSASS